MDEARAYLRRQAGSGGPISGLLNWLSESAFGWSKGGVGAAYQRWLLAQRAPEQLRSERRAEEHARRLAAAAARVAAAPEAVAGLAAVLSLPEARVARMAERQPELLAVTPGEAAQRLVAFKALLPWNDIPALMEEHPRLLACCDAALVGSVLRRRLEALKAGLQGADLGMMMQDHPWVLLEDVEAALPRLHELWPGLDEDALANSHPAHLALALRALSQQGPPARY